MSNAPPIFIAAVDVPRIGCFVGMDPVDRQIALHTGLRTRPKIDAGWP